MKNLKHIDTGSIYNYYATKEGELFKENIRSKEIMNVTPGVNKGGYPIIKLNNKVEYVHRLVFKAFISEEIPPGAQIDHISGVKTDFSVSNLRLVTS